MHLKSRPSGQFQSSKVSNIQRMHLESVNCISPQAPAASRHVTTNTTNWPRHHDCIQRGWFSNAELKTNQLNQYYHQLALLLHLQPDSDDNEDDGDTWWP